MISMYDHYEKVKNIQCPKCGTVDNWIIRDDSFVILGKHHPYFTANCGSCGFFTTKWLRPANKLKRFKNWLWSKL